MIAILLSTYNGEAFLSELLDSIINQSYKDWALFIRDDGSTDSTVKIIDVYIKKNLNIHLIEDSLKHRGCTQSFFYLLQSVNADFYMFADQDDIWLPDKIKMCMQRINMEKDLNRPILIHTDLSVVDKELNTIASSFWNYNGSINKIGFPNVLPVYNYVTGCTMFFNKAVKDICTFPTNAVTMHDAWIALYVFYKGGKIIDLHVPTILYRQHGSNVLGAVKTASILKKIRHFSTLVKGNYKQYRMLRKITEISLVQYLRLKWQVVIS